MINNSLDIYSASIMASNRGRNAFQLLIIYVVLRNTSQSSSNRKAFKVSPTRMGSFTGLSLYAGEAAVWGVTRLKTTFYVINHSHNNLFLPRNCWFWDLCAKQLSNSLGLLRTDGSHDFSKNNLVSCSTLGTMITGWCSTSLTANYYENCKKVVVWFF